MRRSNGGEMISLVNQVSVCIQLLHEFNEFADFSKRVVINVFTSRKCWFQMTSRMCVYLLFYSNPLHAKLSLFFSFRQFIHKLMSFYFSFSHKHRSICIWCVSVMFTQSPIIQTSVFFCLLLPINNEMNAVRPASAICSHWCRVIKYPFASIYYDMLKIL